MTTEGEDPDEIYSPLRRLILERTPSLVATPVLILIVTSLYGFMALTSGETRFSAGTLVRWGALSAPLVATGDWWRLGTGMFLHADPMHLIVNAIVLWRLGTRLEWLLGPPVFLIVYLLTGVIASAASLQFNDSQTIGVGASGAVFGLAGVLLAIALGASLSLRHVPGGTMTSFGRNLVAGSDESPVPDAPAMLRSMLADLRDGLVLVLLYSLFFSFIPRIGAGLDLAAHIGGLVAGLAIGAFVGRYVVEARPTVARTIAPAVLTLALAAGLVAWLAAREDLATEVQRLHEEQDRATAALAHATQDVEAKRQTAAAAADSLQRSLLPAIRELGLRATRLLNTAQRRVADASKRDQYGRLVYWRQLPGLQYDLGRAQAWSDYVTAYGAAWQLRIQGLRDGDRYVIQQAQQGEADAIRRLNATLDSPRPVTPD